MLHCITNGTPGNGSAVYVTKEIVRNKPVDAMQAADGHACSAAKTEDPSMLDKPFVNQFKHVKPGDTPWRGEGLRDFFLYRDLGVADATGGRVIAHLVKANAAPEKGTGWHFHEAEFHIVLMLKGWAKFMYEDKEHLVAAGDCVHQRPGIVHYLFDYSPDMEYLEVVGPANFSTVDADGTCAVPVPATWDGTGT
jgi:mannose-6-phosphate isomerase-like protein (cupin superfamily)